MLTFANTSKRLTAAIRFHYLLRALAKVQPKAKCQATTNLWGFYSSALNYLKVK
jgi:hypothetical protein